MEVDDPIWDVAFGTSVKEKEKEEENEKEAGADCEYCNDGRDREKAEKNFVMQDGNLICQTCRSVIGRQMDYGAEWRFFGAEDSRTSNPTRCGPPTNGLIQSLGCMISSAPRRKQSQWTNRTESSAIALAAAVAAGKTVQRFQVWTSMTYRERVLCGVFDTLTVNAAHNGLPNCILEEAKSLYKKVSDVKITRGENRKAVIAASIYVSCKKNGVPRSHREVANMFDLSAAALTKACRLFNEIVVDADHITSRADDFVGRFCSRLGLDHDVTQKIREVVEKANDHPSVCDAMPTSIVAGAIAMVASQEGHPIERDAIAEACTVAPTTVLKLQKRLATCMAQNLVE